MFLVLPDLLCRILDENIANNAYKVKVHLRISAEYISRVRMIFNVLICDLVQYSD